jgi:RimJ/RimL family protein N-acetyltransferase
MPGARLACGTIGPDFAISPRMDIQPVTLTGRHVRLEPLAHAHVPDLTASGMDPDICQYIPYPHVQTETDMRAWVDDMLARQAKGTDLPFAVIHQAMGRAIGATRYLDIQRANRAVEIGGTWYAPAHQRTAANTETKLLLLSHAFETLGCIRVQLKTDERNVRSQRAIERIGAVKEGILRHSVIMPDGFRRSSVYYSVLAEEWPAVKARLEGMLGFKGM